MRTSHKPPTKRKTDVLLWQLQARLNYDEHATHATDSTSTLDVLIFRWRESHLNFTTVNQEVRVELWINHCTIVACKQVELKLTANSNRD